MLTFPMRPRNGADFCSSTIVNDTRFVAQPKINGIRFIANIRTGEVWNRHGEPLGGAEKYKAHLDLLAQALPESITWVDAESLGRYQGQPLMLFVIDAVLPGTYTARRQVLEAALTVWDYSDLSGVCLMPDGSPVEVWNRCLDLRANPDYAPYVEGIVCKRTDSIYETHKVNATRETNKWVKFRFDQSCGQRVGAPAAAPAPAKEPQVFTRDEIMTILKPALIATKNAADARKQATTEGPTSSNKALRVEALFGDTSRPAPAPFHPSDIVKRLDGYLIHLPNGGCTADMFTAWFTIQFRDVSGYSCVIVGTTLEMTHFSGFKMVLPIARAN